MPTEFQILPKKVGTTNCLFRIINLKILSILSENMKDHNVSFSTVKKKVVKSIFGKAKGNFSPFTKEDRADYHGE